MVRIGRTLEQEADTDVQHRDLRRAITRAWARTGFLIVGRAPRMSLMAGTSPN